MSVPMLDLTGQYLAIQADLDQAVTAVVRSQRFIMGPQVEQLETRIAARTGARFAISCASGTDAILLSLRALELEPGSEVIVPSFTFFATAGAVWNAGLRPVFADIDARTYNLTAQTVEQALTPRTRAVVVVHLYGQMAEMEPLLELARRHDLALIEDAAQSITASQRIAGEERQAGTLGDTGCFSFFPSKNLGGFGDGGLITTNREDLAERLRKLRVHGGRQMYHHEMVGTNSRLDALQAAVLSAKLPYLDGWTEARRTHADHYTGVLGQIPGVQPPFVQPNNHHVFNQYTLRVPGRDRLKARLDSLGIGNAIYYPLPLHLQACFRELGYQSGDLPVTEQAAGEVISIPVYPELTEAQMGEVAGAIVEFIDTNQGEH